MTRKGYFMISHLIIKWPAISSYPNLHQLNYEMPLFYANSGNIASLTFQPRCLSIRPVWSINLRAIPELDSAANKPRELILWDPWRWGGGQRKAACFWRRLLWPPEGLGWRCPRAQVVQEDSGSYPLENSVWKCVCGGDTCRNFRAVLPVLLVMPWAGGSVLELRSLPCPSGGQIPAKG